MPRYNSYFTLADQTKDNVTFKWHFSFYPMNVAQDISYFLLKVENIVNLDFDSLALY